MVNLISALCLFVLLFSNNNVPEMVLLIKSTFWSPESHFFVLCISLFCCLSCYKEVVGQHWIMIHNITRPSKSAVPGRHVRQTLGLIRRSAHRYSSWRVPDYNIYMSNERPVPAKTSFTWASRASLWVWDSLAFQLPDCPEYNGIKEVSLLKSLYYFNTYLWQWRLVLC